MSLYWIQPLKFSFYSTHDRNILLLYFGRNLFFVKMFEYYRDHSVVRHILTWGTWVIDQGVIRVVRFLTARHKTPRILELTAGLVVAHGIKCDPINRCVVFHGLFAIFGMWGAAGIGARCFVLGVICARHVDSSAVSTGDIDYVEATAKRLINTC